MNPFGLGGNQRIKNVLDYHPDNLGCLYSIPDTLQPTNIRHIYMQAKYGTCGAHAGASLINRLFGIVSSPKFLWKIIKSFDGYGLNDGTVMPAIFKALQNTGICELSLLDDSLEDTIESYSSIQELTPAMYQNAANYKINSYAFLDKPTIAQIKQYIAQYGACILLVDCGDGWYTPSWANSDVNPLHLGHFVGHHFICADSYGFTVIDGPNSWSEAWGDKGVFHFDDRYTPNVLELGVVTLSPKYKFNTDFGVGTTSSDVHALQRILGVKNTGYFGPLTLAAVQKFQVLHNIKPVSGFVGPLTRAALNAL